MSTLHILSNPNGTVHFNNRIDPFSIATWKFIHHMTNRGWDCIHYSTPGSVVNCESVNCLSSISTDTQENCRIYNTVAGQEIKKRKHPRDLILCFYGYDNKDAALANADLKIVEPSIGYSVNAVFASFRVFTSYAHMHAYYGFKHSAEPNWFDAVIPNAITPEEFEYSENKSDYILLFGRIIESKGVHIAIQATELAGKTLVIAGSGKLAHLGYDNTPSHVKVLGPCDVEQRKVLMRDAKAVLGPTYYVEPFGNMIVEGYMSGTPAITTDWGGFTETVIPGVTGFRCREMSEFVSALKNIQNIDSKTCRDWAVQNYSDNVIHDKFDHYLKKIITGNFYREIV
jgi:glycosyltransferase involved in cell wall biosynthesis